jgi:hypothetical protein
VLLLLPPGMTNPNEGTQKGERERKNTRGVVQNEEEKLFGYTRIY